jgi:hypothetical protein
LPVATVGGAAVRIMSGLSGTPTLLVMVILNVVMIGAAAWFLSQQETTRERVTVELVRLITVCLEHEKRRPEPP